MRSFIAFFTLLQLLSGSICGAADEITVGLSLGLTGKYALTSTKQSNAYRLFEAEKNQAGGLLGKQVRFIILDNGSNSESAVEQYEHLITEQKVDFIIGPYTSLLTMAVAPIAEKYNQPMLAAGAASDKIWQQGYTNVFGMWTPASRYVLGFLKLLAVNRMDEAVIVTSDEPFGYSLGKGADKWAKVLRIDIRDFIKFEDGKKDFTDLAQQIKGIAPKAVICTGHYYVGAGMKEAFNKLGWRPDIFFATVSPTFQKYYDDFGENAEGDFSTSIWEPHPKLNYPGAYGFAQRYEDTYGEPPTYHAASAYAASEVLFEAILKADSLDKNKVRLELQNLNTMSILGRYAVDKTGLQIKRFPLIIQWQQGVKEIVWPLELQTSPARFNGK